MANNKLATAVSKAGVFIVTGSNESQVIGVGLMRWVWWTSISRRWWTGERLAGRCGGEAG